MLKGLAAALTESINSSMPSTALDDATAPLVSKNPSQQANDPYCFDIPHRQNEQDHQEMRTHNSETAPLSTGTRTSSESVRLSTNMAPLTRVSARVQGPEADRHSRHRELSEEDFAEEWWEICSKSDSETHSNTDSDIDTNRGGDTCSDLNELSGKEDEHRVADTRPEPCRNFHQPRTSPRPSRMPADFEWNRPPKSLRQRGQLRKYAMINWQMVRMRRWWSLGREN